MQAESPSSSAPATGSCLPASPLRSSQVPTAVPTPALSRSHLGALLYSPAPYLRQYLWLSLHLCAPVGGCVSDSPCACLVPACASLPSPPSPLSRFRLPPAALVRGPRPAGSGRLDSGCSNRGENASGSAPSAEPHSSRAGPLLFAAFPAPPRPPGRREGGREGVIEKASEEGERGAGDSGSTRAELPGRLCHG